MSKIRRKVTVENSKTISDSSNSTTTPSRRPSVFERLGPSTASNAAEAVFGEDKVHFNSRFPGSEVLPNTCNVSIMGRGLEGEWKAPL
ncbi:putative selenocysteine lyase [Triplophysa rosa]|uniref:Selenocysteine lyase n=1 Tax=Triplophysa rosa TaxID=992332 RepID=A0A9W7WZ94_TRIRA|nr:putative selenocysteine lyase [Triplophysa rosa]